MKFFIATMTLLISLNSFCQDLNCLEHNGKTYPADKYTSNFIKQVVNRNATSCSSMTVKTAAQMLKKKINISIANPEQQKIIEKAISERRQARIKKKLVKAGLLN